MRSPIKFPEDGGGVHAAETNAASSGGNETGHTPDDARVGIDIEQVDNLPAAADLGTDPFYVENFTPAEIAYCQRQPKPRESLCGLWCAKEAVKKCGAEFLNLRPLELEIRHDAQGRPFPVVLRDGKPENSVIASSASAIPMMFRSPFALQVRAESKLPVPKARRLPVKHQEDPATKPWPGSLWDLVC